MVFQNQVLFKNILKDCFTNLPSADGAGGKSSAKGRNASSAKQAQSLQVKQATDLEPALEKAAMESGLVPHKPWITKSNQLYTLSQVYNGKG